MVPTLIASHHMGRHCTWRYIVSDPLAWSASMHHLTYMPYAAGCMRRQCITNLSCYDLRSYRRPRSVLKCTHATTTSTAAVHHPQQPPRILSSSSCP